MYFRTSDTGVLRMPSCYLKMSTDQGRPSSPVNVELTEADIPGALLGELLEAHNVEALKWWLLCRGIKVPS